MLHCPSLEGPPDDEPRDQGKMSPSSLGNKATDKRSLDYPSALY